MRNRKESANEARQIRRKIAILEAEKSKFNSTRIGRLQTDAELWDEDFEHWEQKFVELGKELYLEAIPIFEGAATVIDMAAIANCHHSKIEKIITVEGQPVSFTNLIFVHHIEVR
jgi:hypothetical protein